MNDATKKHSVCQRRTILKASIWKLIEADFSADYRAKWGTDNLTIGQIEAVYEAAVEFGA